MRSPHYSFSPHWCLERGSTVYLSAPYLYENKPDGFYILLCIYRLCKQHGLRMHDSENGDQFFSDFFLTGKMSVL